MRTYEVRYLISSPVDREGIMLPVISEMKSAGQVKQMRKVLPQRENSLCRGLKVGELVGREDLKTVQWGQSVEWEMKMAKRGS